MNPLKFRTPVTCQNGHKAFWYWEIDSSKDIGHVRHIGVPEGPGKCSCPKGALGEGYVRAGPDQMFAGYLDTAGKEVYEGDLVTAPYHWTEPHEIRLPEDFYAFSEFALGDCLTAVGSAFLDRNLVEVKP